MCTCAGEAEEGYGGQRRTLSGGIFAEVSAENPGHNLRLSGVQVHQCGEKIVAGREEEEEEEEEEATSGEGHEEEAGRGDDNLMCT